MSASFDKIASKVNPYRLYYSGVAPDQSNTARIISSGHFPFFDPFDPVDEKKIPSTEITFSVN